MNGKKPWYKRKKFWKWAGISYLSIMLIGIVGGFLLDITGYSDKVEAEQQAQQEAAQAKKVDEKTKPTEVKSEESEVTPLSKEDVLAKFAIDSGVDPYIDSEFIFVGSRTDTADYYSLADTDHYSNASVIFKDGQIARVKLIPGDGQDVNKLFEEFGITDEPRKLSGVAGAYEIALIPKYWSQNIERYPFELD